MKSFDLQSFLVKDRMTNLMDQDNLLYDFRQVAVNDNASLAAFSHTEPFTAVGSSSQRNSFDNNLHCSCKPEGVTFLIFHFYFIYSVSDTF